MVKLEHELTLKSPIKIYEHEVESEAYILKNPARIAYVR